MTNIINRTELEAYSKYLIGRQCPIHPDRIIKDGKFGLWCGAKDEMNTWCSGGGIDKQWIINWREKHEQ